MAMMMTGRVLLVCALCVLWCGAGRCQEALLVSQSEVPGAIEGDGGQPRGSSGFKMPESHAPGSEASVREVQQEQDPSPPREETQLGTKGGNMVEKAKEKGAAKDAGKEGELDGKTIELKKPEDKLTSVEGQQLNNNEGLHPTTLNGPNGVETTTPSREILSVREDQQDLSSSLLPPLHNTSPGGTPPSTPAAGRADTKSHENDIGKKNSQQSVVGDIGQNNDTGEKAVDSTGEEEGSRLSVATVEEMSETTKKSDSGGTATTTAVGTDIGTEETPPTNHPSKPSTEGATTPGTTSDGEAASTNKYDTVSQNAGSTTAATTNATTGDTAKKGDSDSSTAVPHTTSPLLLLLVACAAAAAVVAA
ncbi:Mucin-associated surface protein (MASP) [Trypanosoma cruzi]|uniref:Mucin-associated surface protein (MASP), putative n=2 Tax=Trypanosoma cruzi TaxID=5693 RepID=Q4DTY9_TRYCC|nr:mucin-associated surface protein (MASP), putative [Trypanosoma cruzi]EAN96000.1 mucin-associated surface protein (MASP), putative [Trypanosoma cruzi]PWV03489.1 Mucin-associated surface protein (MASP) [Trypanosoma cruzi]|eukprot:XP_817851.1 mucin-associated surface protein (MASP) [Trypanosoma cruzi strain CL Brener]